MLIVVPIVLITYAKGHLKRKQVGTHPLLAVMVFAMGFAIQPALTWLDQGTLKQSYAPIAEYEGRLKAQKLSSSGSSSITDPLRRFDYLSWLLFSNTLALAITAVALFEKPDLRKLGGRSEVALFTAGAIVFVLFLMFCPVSFQPLVFVEMRPRYLTVVIPLWALALAGVVSYAFNQMVPWKQALWIVLTAAYAFSGIWEADNRLSWSRHTAKLHVDGLRECLRIAKERGIDTVAATQYLLCRVPNECMRGTPKVVILQPHASTASVDAILATGTMGNKGIYIARAHPKALQQTIIGDDVFTLKTPDSSNRFLLEKLQQSGWTPTPVFVSRRVFTNTPVDCFPRGRTDYWSATFSTLKHGRQSFLLLATG